MLLTKEQAAIRQTEAAIDAMHRGDYDIAITLAGAAEGMFDRSDRHLFQFMRDHPRVSEVPRKEWVAILNRERDWLKHSGDQDSMRLECWEAAMMIARAASKLQSWTQKIEQFRVWYSDNYEDLLREEQGRDRSTS